MHFDESGRGPAVLLLPGTPTPPEHLLPVARALEHERRVLIAHLPGYGKTPAVQGAYSVHAVREELERDLLARGIESCAVLGYSGGAYRAIALALEGKVRVERLYLLSPQAGADDAARAIFRAYAGLLRNPAIDARAAWLQAALPASYVSAHPLEANEVASWIDCVPREALAAEMEGFAEAPDLHPRLRELSMPVVARIGALDASLAQASAPRMPALNPNIRLETVPGCGHALLIEDRDETLRSITRFLLAAG